MASPSEEPQASGLADSEHTHSAPSEPPRRLAPLPRGVSRSTRSIARFLYCHNPFYVISAAFVFWGLRSSFDTSGRSFETGALLAGLAGYTLILAFTAWFLVWVGQVWNDVRTILLLVVLMLLAMSITFDETLARNPAVGVWYFLGGFVFSIAVSEGLLRGLPLALPALFRVPYYLILALFFLYPLALQPLLGSPREPALAWAMFCFPTVAGVLFWTLLPAIRRGPEYVANNGSPWRWPLYPWVLFGTLGLGVCGRSFYLCGSFHFVGGTETIFGAYFLVPFLLAATVLLLEIGRRAGNEVVVNVAMAIPWALVWLASTPLPRHAHDLGFLRLFTEQFGATPLCLTWIGVVGFYVLAMILRVAGASWWTSAALWILAWVGPKTVGLETIEPLQCFCCGNGFRRFRLA